MPEKLLTKFPLAIASMSLGRAAHHTLESKLAAAAAAGFTGIEVFYEDLKLPARAMTSTASSFADNLLLSAAHMRALCDQHGLTIIVLQPFKNYDGLLSPQRHAEKIQKLHHWFKIARVLRVDTIQIPSMFHLSPAVATGDTEKLVADLREVADLGAAQTPPVRFAYEFMAWGAHVSSWQRAWEIVSAVDRANFGMCLDTFQTLATIWGDCTSRSGIRPNAAEVLRADLDEFVATVPLEKVYYVQLADAERLEPPLAPGHEWWGDKGMRAEMVWSRNARLFPGEGYLPCLDMLRAWIGEWGYRGWVSMELFSRSMNDPAPGVPAEHARRGMESWRMCVKELGLEEREE
ncbi:xylose isomerase-like protein [Geopyxis carbonaria]|nr:xylose isomerase-like protein [Geopyxis carbonaria]